jgi:hypothetical protein
LANPDRLNANEDVSASIDFDCPMLSPELNAPDQENESELCDESQPQDSVTETPTQIDTASPDKTSASSTPEETNTDASSAASAASTPVAEATARDGQYICDGIKGAHETENPVEYQRKPPPADFSKSGSEHCLPPRRHVSPGKKRRRKFNRKKRALAAKKKALAEAISASIPLRCPAVTAQNIRNFKAKTRTSLAGFLKACGTVGTGNAARRYYARNAAGKSSVLPGRAVRQWPVFGMSGRALMRAWLKHGCPTTWVPQSQRSATVPISSLAGKHEVP